MSSNAPSAPVKVSWKTSEFWITVIIAVVGLLTASGLFCTATDTPTQALVCKGLGLATSVLTAMGYSVSRGLAKSGGS